MPIISINMELKVVKITEDAAEGWERLLVFVPQAKREHVRSFARPTDALRTLAGELLARSWLMQQAGMENRSIHFKPGPHGKPALQPDCSLHFNVSHSGDWVAAAFSRAGPVGVDVEQTRPVDMALAKRFFAADEYDSLMACPADERAAIFFQYWTLKESYLKARGSGLTARLSSFSINLESETIEICKNNEKLTGFFFKSYMLDANHTLALCAAEATLPDEPGLCAWSELASAFDSKRDSL